MTHDRADRACLRLRSRRRFAFFHWYARRFLAQHFHAVRVLPDPRLPAGPCIVCLNHPSWWDPLISLVLAEHLRPRAEHLAPIDAAALERHRFFRRLGFFPIAPDTAAGARTLLDTARAALLPGTDRSLWITAQGRFTDARERPVRLRPGVGLVASRLGLPVVPVAIECPFWNERQPEALIAVGASVMPTRDARSTTAAIADALTGQLDRLAATALARDPTAFATLIGGGTGTHPAYDAWRRLRALLAGGPSTSRAAASPAIRA